MRIDQCKHITLEQNPTGEYYQCSSCGWIWLICKMWYLSPLHISDRAVQLIRDDGKSVIESLILTDEWPFGS